MTIEFQTMTDEWPNLDAVDVEILQHVEQAGMDDIDDLAGSLDMAKSTIYYRIDKLKHDGIITGVTADLNPVALGLKMLLISNISVSREIDSGEDIGEKLRDIDGILHVYYTIGETDYIAISRVQNRGQMDQLINEIISIDGISSTTSTFVMKEIKSDGKFINSMSSEMIATLTE